MENHEAGEAPRRATISEVLGRGSSPEPGLAPIHSMVLETDDGGTIKIGRIRNPAAVSATVTILDTAAFKSFDRCPICLEPNPTSREHVPPESVGGMTMTLTCHRCNNDLGSRVEADLTAWLDDSILAWFAHDSVPGRRRVPPILVRQGGDGQPVLVIGPGGLDSSIPGMLARGGGIEATFQTPDFTRVRLAILKSVYLAACLFLDELPQTARADAIRTELLNARDRPRSEHLILGAMAGSLAFGRWEDGERAPGEIALVSFTPPDTEAPQLYISLARVLLIEWPLEPLYAKVVD